MTSLSGYLLAILVLVFSFVGFIRSASLTDDQDNPISMYDVIDDQPVVADNSLSARRYIQVPNRRLRTSLDYPEPTRHDGVEMQALHSISEVEKKRGGNSAWIWMPAQGYISMPKGLQHSSSSSYMADNGKHGRVMRYGK